MMSTAFFFTGLAPRARAMLLRVFRAGARRPSVPPARHTPPDRKESPAMGSIKKKRRAKMSKHKHDKRIKLERHKTK